MPLFHLERNVVFHHMNPARKNQNVNVTLVVSIEGRTTFVGNSAMRIGYRFDVDVSL